MERDDFDDRVPLGLLLDLNEELRVNGSSFPTEPWESRLMTSRGSRRAKASRSRRRPTTDGGILVQPLTH
jgi:hypothetical protein